MEEKEIKIVQKSKITDRILAFIKSSTFALIIAAVSAILSFVSIRLANNQKDILTEHKDALKTVADGVFTKPIKKFPESITEITDFIDKGLGGTKEKPRKEKSVTLEIYTDFLGYGVLSRNEAFKHYFDVIKKYEDKQTIKWYHYNANRQKTQNERQFASFKEKEDDEENKLEKTRGYLKDCSDNAYSGCDKHTCSYRASGECYYKTKAKDHKCFLIRRLQKKVNALTENKNDTCFKLLVEISRLLQKMVSEDAESYIPQVEKNPLDVRFPFFAWFILEGETPKESIITFPAYGTMATEQGFQTSNAELVEVLRKTMLDRIEDKDKDE